MPRFLSDQDVENFRLQLVEVATRRFAEHGVGGVTLRGLADEVGCSRTTPYRYFKNKDEILAAVRASAFSRLADATERAASRASDAIERLEAGGRAYLRFAAEDPDAYLSVLFIHPEEFGPLLAVAKLQRSGRFPPLVTMMKATDSG